MKKTFDIMSERGRYIHTMSIDINPLFPLTEEEIIDHVIERLPTLKGEKITILFDNMQIHI